MADDNSMRICKNCGTPLPPGAKFCEECGTTVVDEAPVAAEASYAPNQAPLSPTRVEEPAPQPSYEPTPQQSYHAAPQPSYEPAPQQSYNAAPQPSYNAAPQQSYNAAPQQSYNAAPQPGYNPAPQQSYNAAPQPGYNPAPQPGYTPAAQPGYNPAPQPAFGGTGTPIPQQKKSKTWLFVLIGALVVLAIAAVIVFVVIKPFGGANPAPTPETTIAPIPTSPTPTVAPTAAPTEAPTAAPTAAPSTGQTNGDIIVGTWHILRTYDVNTKEITSMVSSTSSMTVWSDGTGRIQVGTDTTYDLTWSFDEIDDDGDYVYAFWLNNSSKSYMYYMHEQDEIWVIVGDSILCYGH